MTTTTRKQRESLLALYRRGAIYQHGSQLPLTYREFRRTVQPTFFCDGAVVVNMWGMWICVERDGYAHS